MDTYLVFFNKMWFFGKDKGLFPIDFTLVAVVESETIEDCFRATNHIDFDWWLNPEIKYAVRGSRSMSVGDVAYSTKDGNFYRCLSVGWKLEPVFAPKRDIRRLEDDEAEYAKAQKEA